MTWRRCSGRYAPVAAIANTSLLSGAYSQIRPSSMTARAMLNATAAAVARRGTMLDPSSLPAAEEGGRARRPNHSRREIGRSNVASP